MESAYPALNSILVFSEKMQVFECNKFMMNDPQIFDRYDVVEEKD